MTVPCLIVLAKSSGAVEAAAAKTLADRRIGDVIVSSVFEILAGLGAAVQGKWVSDSVMMQFASGFSGAPLSEDVSAALKTPGRL